MVMTQNGGTKTDEQVSMPPFSQEILVGTCGFEPQTPTVSILETELYQTLPNERK
jgi:hypothetical protein